MGHVVRFEAPGRVALVECADRRWKPAACASPRCSSGISAGTELTAYTGTNPYTRKRWDGARRLFVDGDATHPYPIDGWGYEEVGRVVELGPAATGIAVGDIVYGVWGHRSEHVADAEWAAARVLPAGADPLIGVFARIGAIALNAVHDAAPRVGDVVAVFGQGVPGLLVTQLLGLAGATVIAVDAIPRRLDLARRFGADHVVDFTVDPAGGADQGPHRPAAAPTSRSRSAAPIGRCTRRSARRPTTPGSSSPASLRARPSACSWARSSTTTASPSSARRSPEPTPSWITAGTSPRLERTVVELAAAGRLDVTSLVTHTFPAADVAAGLRAPRRVAGGGRAGGARLRRAGAVMRLACQERLLPGDTLLERWDSARRTGYDGIELHGSPDFALGDRLPELRRAAAAGVVFSSVCVAMRHFIGDFDADLRRDAIANLKSQLSVIAELGGVGVVTPAAYGMYTRKLPPFAPPPRTEDEDVEVLVDGPHRARRVMPPPRVSRSSSSR